MCKLLISLMEFEPSYPQYLYSDKKNTRTLKFFLSNIKKLQVDAIIVVDFPGYFTLLRVSNIKYLGPVIFTLFGGAF